MTHFYSKYPILRIVSTTLDSDIDLAHCAAWDFLLSVLKQGYSLTDGGIFILSVWLLFSGVFLS